jgi:hypothetical protein
MSERSTPDSYEPAVPPATPQPSEPSARPEPGTVTLEQEDDWVADYEALPHRPRRRLITPVNLGLFGLLLVVGGFIGGVFVEKGQVSSASTAAPSLPGLAGRGGTAAGGAATGVPRGVSGTTGAAANTTSGTVSAVDHGTLYVTDSEGTTIKVMQASGGTVTRTAVSSASHIHPGDTVIVSGPKASDGTVTATSIRATASNAASSGLASLFGGAAPTGAGTAPTSGTGATSSASPSLFGSG